MTLRIILCIVASLLHISHSADVAFECPEGYSKDGYKKGTKRCYAVFGESEGAMFQDAKCRRFSMLPFPIQHTQNERLEKFVRKYFKDKKSDFSFPGIWLDLKAVREGQGECFKAFHHQRRKQPCYRRNGFPHWKINAYNESLPEQIAGSGDCVYMILDEPVPWYRSGPLWRRKSCDEKMPFVCEVVPCPKGTFNCIRKGKTKCMRKAAICNGKKECDDGADETGCPQGCVETITLPKGLLSSPNFPGKYGPYEKCRWTIEAEVNQRISIKIHFIDIESGVDNLVIIDGETTDNDKILKRINGKLPGQKLPKVPLSTSNVVTVLFTTDGSVQGFGFNLTYETVSPESHSLTATAALQCLTSPNYPEDYDRDSEYLITSPTGSVISLQFTEFNLAPDDRIIVRDGQNKSAPKIRPTLTVFMSYGNAMLVSFETKDTDFNGRKRFKACYVEGCHADVKTGSAELESPGRSSYGKYPQNLKCGYTVRSLGRLSISFEEDFWTELDKDKVEVYCGNAVPPSRVLHGDRKLHPPETLVIQNCPYIKFNFTSDVSVEHRGWRAKISHDCNPLPALPSDLNRSTEHVHVNVKVVYSCVKEGYEVVGVNPQVCGLNGKWLSEVPKCELKHCGEPKHISTGHFVYTIHKKTYGGEVEYNCDFTHHLDDVTKKRRKCVMSGWEEPLPECKETFCPDLSELVARSPNLKVSNTTRQGVGSSAKYECEKGYRSKRNYQRVIVCQKADGHEKIGKWSSSVIPECEKIQCDTNNIAVEFGKVDLSPHTRNGLVDIGEEVSVQCPSGYEVIPSGTATCEESGEFDTELLKCKDTDECTGVNPCGHNRTCVNSFGGYWCECNTGYELNETETGCVDVNECEIGYDNCAHKCVNTPGSFVCECRSGFTKESGTGQCISTTTCPLLEAPQYGAFEYHIPLDSSTEKISPGTTMLLRCSVGYTNEGGVRKCQSDGKWSGNVQSCKRIECPIEKLEQSVTVTYLDGTFLGSVATYSCKSGFSFTEGNRVRFCEQDPTSNATHPKYGFSGKQPVCISDTSPMCPPPLVSQLVNVTMSSDNTTVTYDCPTGYQLAGQASSKCVAGKWNGPPPVCVLQDKQRYCSIPTLPVNAESFTPSDINYHQLEYADPQSRNKYYRVAAVGSKIGLKCKPGYQVHGDELVCIGKDNINGTCSLAGLMTNLQNRVREIKRFFENSNSTFIEENYSQVCRFLLPYNCSLEYWYGMVIDMNRKLEWTCRRAVITNAPKGVLTCNLDSYIDNLLHVETRVTDRDELCRHILNTTTIDNCIKSVTTTPADLLFRSMVELTKAILQTKHQCGLGYCDLYPNQPQPSGGGGGSCEWKNCLPRTSSPSEPFSICHPPGTGTDSPIIGNPYQERQWNIIESQSKSFWMGDHLGHWFSRSPPICIDKQPPTFNFCPPSVDVWPESGTSPIDRITGNVTDNVDQKPMVRVLVSGPHIPTHTHAFVAPSELKREDVIGGYLTFVANDQDGNIAMCSVRGPSIMYCAKRSITLIMPTQDKEIHFNKTDIAKTQFVHSSVKETVRTPAANGTLPVQSSGELVVEAQDFSGNNKTCRVKYSLQTSLCAQWTLTIPPGASASFTGSPPTLATVSCTAGYVPFRSTYTCKGGEWSPSHVAHCLKVFEPVEARLDINMTASAPGVNLNLKATADCLNSYLTNTTFIQNLVPSSCRSLSYDVAILSRKLKKELLDVNTTLQVRFKAFTENGGIIECLNDLANVLKFAIAQGITTPGIKNCPDNIRFMTKDILHPVGVSYSKCFHPRAFHKNLTLIVNFTSTTTNIDMNSSRTCVGVYFSVVPGQAVIRCKGITIPAFILYSKAAVVVKLGFYSKMHSITLDSLQDCWLALLKKARDFYGRPVELSGHGLHCQIPQLTATLTRIEERDNLCEPGKVPLAGRTIGSRYCPASMYASGNKCRQCPPGTSSGLGKTACSLKGDVMIQCTPGLFSSTGFEPCEFCPIGTYSETNMSTSCTPCPCKQKTPRRGATSRRDCGASNGMYCLKKVIREYVFNRLQTTGHPNVIASGSYVSISHNRNTSVQMVYGKNYDLSATAVDENGKTLTCNYTYSIESRFCSPDSLVLPEGVRIKECSPANAIDQVAESYNCSFECTSTTGFMFYGGVYHCSDGKWSPSRVVTPCAPAQVAFFDIGYVQTLIYQNSSIAKSEQSKLALLGQTLDNATARYNRNATDQGCPIKLQLRSSVTAPILDVIMVTFNITLGTNLPITTDISTNFPCYNLLNSAVQAITNSYHNQCKTQCYPTAHLIINGPVARLGCSYIAGILSGNRCMTCPPGTNRSSDGKSCQQVPKGYYYSQAVADKYEACPTGTSTLHEQSMSQDDCIAECKAGTYSHTGLEPCNPCEKGTYSDVRGATSCKPCPDCNSTTLDIGSQSPTDCKRASPCGPGTYSDSGNTPCMPCPVHHYTSLSGSSKCQTCPFRNATWSTGSTSCQDAIYSFKDTVLERNSSFPFAQYLPVGSLDNLHYDEAYYAYQQPPNSKGPGKVTVKVTFQPPSGSINASLGVHTIKAASTDEVGAPVSRRFQIDVRPLSSCEPTNNMQNSRNAGGLCWKPGPAGNGYSCTFTCNNGFVFSDYTNKKTFTCEPGQDWKRDVNIPDCAAIMRGYRFESKQTLAFSKKINSTCIQAVKYKRIKALKNLTDVCVVKYPHTKGMKVESIVTSENRDSENTLVIGTISDISSLGTVSYTECFKLIVDVLRKGDDSIEYCPTLVRPMTFNTSQTTYPCSTNSYTRRDSATLLDECVFCSSGSFLNKTSSRCDICAKGTYQDEVGSTSCKKCPSGTWTYNSGSKSFDDCIVQCDQYGLINPVNGLPPCLSCKDQYEYTPADPVTCKDCYSVKDMFCPMKYGRAWCFQCDFLGTAECNTNNGDVPCVCKPNYSGKFCEINLRKSACESSPCKNGGRCFVSHLEKERGYKCFCPAGFEGPNCEKNVDDCTATSCLHGTCLDGNGTYFCHCDQGYMGERCEVPIDECYSLPCVNGFCERRINGFYCNCFGTPFTGKFCNETFHHEMTCGPNICLNGGRCMTFATNSTFEKCDCKSGAHGKFCEKVDSLCKPHNNPCKNGGACVQESYNSFKCVCKHGSGFTGRLCDVRKTPCSPNPCNNGTCQVDGSFYRCSCPLVSGRRVYYGHNCEKMNPCADNPCKYGKCIAHGHDWKCNCTSGLQGAYCNETVDTCSLKTANGQLPCEPSSTKYCTSIVTNYTKPDVFCHCKEGWEGKNCAKDIDECTKTKNPCQNNGTCFNTPGHFRCDCTLGLWEGKLCDVLKKDPCTPPGPCKNGGNCTRTADGFLCSCPVEWKGKTCEEDVNECQAAIPCQHGTCTNTTGGFKCSCFKGYEGKQCSNMIDMCKSSPCQNDGECTSFLNGYNCSCPDEYTGKNCETAVDDCAPEKAGAKPCGDNGSCIDGWRSYSCKCNYDYAGPKCHKRKLPNFDLVFRGFNSSSYYTATASLTDSMTVEFWVRFASYQGKETFLTIALEDLGTASSKRDVLVYNGEGVTLSMFPETRLIKEPVNNTNWKYVVLVISGGKLLLYQNGKKKLEESQSFLGLKGSLHVTLGTPATSKTRHGFTGEISRLNIYKRALQISEINAAVDKCFNHSGMGDVFSWLMFDSEITNVERVEPSICGTSDCSDGFKGPNCTIQIDSVPPEVVYCPEDIIFTNATHRLSPIKWPPPKFTDNVGIARITSNHRIGEVFAYGEYPIVYVAYDGEGNSAICQFKIHFHDEHCQNPRPPHNGMVVYGELTWVKFAQIACKNLFFAFTIPPPPFYTCIADGKWFPNKEPNQPLVFPSCSERFPPELRLIFGLLKIPIDRCSDHRKSVLSNTMNKIIDWLHSAFNICDGPCNPDIKVECGGGPTSGGRRKRQTTNDTINAILSYDLRNIKLNSTRIKLDTGNFSSLLDTLLKMIKEQLASRNTSGIENNEVKDVSIDTTPICPKGSVLGLDNKCANCSRGTYYQEMEKPQQATCVNCHRGFYQDLEAQTNCKPCDKSIKTKYTTLAEGSHDASQCYPYCSPGHYYSHVDKACIRCRLGYYQNSSGMFSCHSCENGQTTLGTGATSKNNCTAFCPLGSELATDGRCKECPLGTYRSQSQQPACLQCPYTDSTIYLTANPGATSETMCSVVTCRRGHYRNADGCNPCHLGMYQPAITTNESCIRCPKGMTTASERATSADDCQPGSVDECLYGSHDCDVNGVCTDTDDSFLCTCKPGYVGDGRECIPVSPCANSTCLNGGTCRVIRGAPQCDCPQTHKGDRCETEKPLPVNPTIIIISSVAAVIGVLFIAVLIGVCVFKCRRGNNLPKHATPTSYVNPGRRDEPMENDNEERPLTIRPAQFANPAFKMQLDCEDEPETGQRTPPVDYDQDDFEVDDRFGVGPGQPSSALSYDRGGYSKNWRAISAGRRFVR